MVHTMTCIRGVSRQTQQRLKRQRNNCLRGTQAVLSVGVLLLLVSSWTASVACFKTSAPSRILRPFPSSMKLGMTTFMQQRRTKAIELGGRTVTGSSNTFLNMICLDQNEFELHVGHAMDVLRSDYPSVLTQNPDFSIYDKGLEVIDPAGVKLHGISNYRAVFTLLHAVVGVFYCPERSAVTFRMCYDKARQNIRISWNAQVIPRVIFGGAHKTLYVDGISIYEVSKYTGNVTQHRVEKLVINDRMVMPEQGIVTALRGYAQEKNVDPIPVFNSKTVENESQPSVVSTAPVEELYTMSFSTPPSSLTSTSATGLFQSSSPVSSQHHENSLGGREAASASMSLSASKSPSSSKTQLEMSQSSSSALNSEDLDWEALERKNASRKKFGLPPLSPEEFVELQKQVDEMDSVQRERAAAAAADIASKKKEKETQGFFKKMLGNVLEDTCESNFDCERPQVCCDFGFKKMCCTSGMRVLDGPRSREGQLAEIPVIANPNPYPPTGDGRNNGGYPGLGGY